MVVTTLLATWGASLAFATLVWAFSVKRKDTSIVDQAWGLMFLVAVAVAYGLERPAGALPLVMLGIVGLWAVRLSVHIHVRHRGRPEDRRYTQMRSKHPEDWWWRSLFTVFWLQATLMMVVAAPALYVATQGGTWNVLAWIGVGVWGVGFLFEAVADWQLLRFKRRQDGSTEVMDQGLWRYSRHPNYFGEAMLWWGLGLVALAVGGWWTLFGPAFLTFLLLRVSGVRMLDKDQKERKPEYAAYIRRTSAFVPLPPRKDDP